MTVESNKQLVRVFFDVIPIGDTARMSTLMTDDATWWHPPTIKGGGTKKKREFLESLPSLLSQFEGPLSLHIESMTAEDDRMSVIASGGGKLKSGKVYSIDVHFAIQVRDGKIAHVKEYMDSAYVNEVFGD